MLGTVREGRADRFVGLCEGCSGRHQGELEHYAVFDQKIPAPIKAAREVGRILKHIPFGMELEVSPDFRKYT